jgi:hypothetical protein
VTSPSPHIWAQRERWTVPVTQPLLLCSQAQRSGGTLLIRLFDGHPSCFTHPNELRWGKPLAWPEPDLTAPLDANALFAHMAENWPRKFAMDGYGKYSKWTTERHPDEVVRYPFIFDVGLQRRIFAAALARHSSSRRDVLDAYLTSLFNAWLDYQNLYAGPKEWVVAFEPRLAIRETGLDAFFADYSDGLLVTIVREPGAWLASFLKHVDTEPRLAIRRWIRSAERGLQEHAAHPDRVAVVLFEDLVQHTEVVMRALCERMRIPFSDVLLSPTYNSMPVLSDSSHQMTTGLDTATVQRRGTFSPDVIALVDKWATPLYLQVRERFGLVTAEAPAQRG